MKKSIGVCIFATAALALSSGAGCARSGFSFEALTTSSNPNLDTGVPDPNDSSNTTSSGGSTSGGTTTSSSSSTSTTGGSSSGSASSGSSSSGGGAGAGGAGTGGAGAGNGGGGGTTGGAGATSGGTSQLPSNSGLMQCMVGGASTKVASGGTQRILGQHGNDAKSRVCMSANACLTLINAYAVARGCTLQEGAPTTPEATGQCTERFPGSFGVCHHAISVSDEEVSSLLESMAE